MLPFLQNLKKKKKSYPPGNNQRQLEAALTTGVAAIRRDPVASSVMRHREPWVNKARGDTIPDARGHKEWASPT